jgi:hypothetical protein
MRAHGATRRQAPAARGHGSRRFTLTANTLAIRSTSDMTFQIAITSANHQPPRTPMRLSYRSIAVGLTVGLIAERAAGAVRVRPAQEGGPHVWV